MIAFLGFRGTYQMFWPQPLHVEDPCPTRIRTQKFEFVLLSLA